MRPNSPDAGSACPIILLAASRCTGACCLGACNVAGCSCSMAAPTSCTAKQGGGKVHKAPCVRACAFLYAQMVHLRGCVDSNVHGDVNLLELEQCCARVWVQCQRAKTGLDGLLQPFLSSASILCTGSAVNSQGYGIKGQPCCLMSAQDLSLN